MAVTTTNLTMGPGAFWIGALAVAEPTGLAAPGVGWRDVGGTQDGITLNVAETLTELDVDQLVDIPERRRTKREMTVATNVAETTLENLADAINEPAPAAAVAGLQSLDVTTGLAAFRPAYRACLFDGPGVNNLTRRVIVRKTLSTEGTEFAYKKDGQNVYSITRAAHFVSDAIKPFIFREATAA